MSDELSMRGVIDIDRIEGILRSFSARLGAQETLLGEVVKRDGDGMVEGIRTGVDRALEAIERRFVQLETRLQRQESCQPRLTSLERSMDRSNRAVQSKAEVSALDMFRSEMKIEMESLSASVDARLTDSEAMLRLESGQRQLTRQLSAVQEMIACKADRTEIPLMQTASERVRAADDFRVEAGPRIDRIEQELKQTRAALESKEERSAVVERMQAIYNEFQKRPERSSIEKEIELPLDELRKRVEVLQCDVALIQPQNVADALHELRADVAKTERDSESFRQRLEQVDLQVKSRASVRLVDKKADKAYCEQLVHEISMNGDQKLAVTTANVEQIRRQILELKQIQNEVDEKLGVSLRFLDWFSSVQLDKQMRSSAF